MAAIALAIAWWWWLPWKRCGLLQLLPYRVLIYFPCKQPPITKLWVFGDSTVDSGWFRVAPYSGETKFDNYISVPALGVGRPTSSPGLMSVEVLANALHTSAAPQNQSGTNYATGGARNAQMNTATTGGFPNAIPTVTQIQNYLAGNQPNARMLFLVSSGGNDVAYALRTGGIDPASYVQQQAQSLAGAIQSLQQRGGQFIIVVGLPESFGSPAEKQTLRAAYDSALKAALTQDNVFYAWGDLNGLRKLIEQYNGGTNPFGISHYFNSNPACSQPMPNADPTLTIASDWAYVCSPATGAPSTPAAADTYEFADDSHWATGAQKVFGGYFLCLAEARWQQLDWSTVSPPYNCNAYSPLVVFPY